MIESMEYDPNSREAYICINCTMAARLMTQKREVRIYHPNDHKSQAHQVPFYGVMTIGQQRALFDYQDRVDAQMGHAIGEFLHRREFEDRLGFRDPDAEPLSVIRIDPTFEYLATRSDVSDRPMFPEEIREWVNAHRTAFAFPENCLDVRLKYDITYRTMLTQIEVFCLCIYINHEVVGSGSQVFAGRLRITNENGDEVSEKELEDHWDGLHRL